MAKSVSVIAFCCYRTIYNLNSFILKISLLILNNRCSINNRVMQLEYQLLK